MNYMEQVAKMLGVEIGHYFEICGRYGTYFLSYDGLYQIESGCEVEKMLSNLLSGECTIKHKPWKPKHDETYYCVGASGYIHLEKWYGDLLDTLYYKLGNCYKCKKQAEADRDKWLAFYKSDDVLEV